MKKLSFLKALGLVALLLCGAWSANAQVKSLGIAQQGTNDALENKCIDVNTTTEFKAIPLDDSSLDDFINLRWRATGGITVPDNSTGATVVVSIKPGVTYEDEYSKYAKGKLTLTYQAKLPSEYDNCGIDEEYFPTFTKEIDIYKEFTVSNGANPIVGPTCIAEGEKVTYSVEPWVSMYMANSVGFDEYEWDIPENLIKSGSEYYSADESSISFEVARPVTAGEEIKVRIGRCNAEFISLVLRQAVPEPKITPLDCLPGGEQTQVFSIQGGAIPGVDYKWTVDENWRIIDGSNRVLTITNQGEPVTIETDMSNPATITVEASYADEAGCKSTFSTSRIKRSINPEISTISISPNVSCFSQNEEVIFTLNNAPSPATFAWTLPTGWEYVDPMDINRQAIKLRATDNAETTGKIEVRVDGCLSTFDYAEYEVNMKPGDAKEITIDGGSFCITQGKTYTFRTTQTTPAAYDFDWVFGTGWNQESIDVSEDGLSVTAEAIGNTIGNITVTPIGKTEGCTGNSKTVNVSYPPVAPIGITVPSCVNVGVAGSATLSVIPNTNTPSNQKYMWTLGNLGNTVLNTPTITVPTSADIIEGNYPVSVVAYTNLNICSTNPYSNRVPETVVVDGLDFRVEAFTAKGGTAWYEITQTQNWDIGSMTYYWELNEIDETDYTYQQSTNYLTNSNLLLPTSTDKFSVTINDNGCLTRRQLGGASGYAMLPNISNPGLRSAKMPKEDFDIPFSERSNSSDIILSPNPAKDAITISFPAGATEVRILSLQGSILDRVTTNAESVTINISDLISGNYIVTVKQNGQVTTKKLIISK